MTTNLKVATTTTGAVIDPSVGDGTFALQVGATAGAQVTALSIAADGTPTFLKPLNGGSLTLGTAQNTTSGTSIDFTGIPSWVKRVTVTFNGVSTNGTSPPMVQLGKSGGPETTGYAGAATGIGAGGGVAQSALSTGFQLCDTLNNAAGATWSGNMVIALQDASANRWSASGNFGRGDSAVSGIVGGSKALAGVLDRIRLTTINGTDTFDAGSVNILYEG